MQERTLRMRCCLLIVCQCALSQVPRLPLQPLQALPLQARAQLLLLPPLLQQVLTNQNPLVLPNP
jgi:hypothetical protein